MGYAHLAREHLKDLVDGSVAIHPARSEQPA